MYVRNYGMPPRTAIKADEPLGTGISMSPEPSPEENRTMDRTDAPAKEEPSEPQSTVENTSAEATTDNAPSAAAFGSSGIPRQPLRRRKIPKKTEEHGKSPQNGEKAPTQSEPRYPFICSDEPPDTGNRVCNAEPPSKPDPCEIKRKQSPSHRKPFGGLSTEELLLGVSILLMLNDHASDEILLILAFLLVSDLDLNKREN